MSKVKINVRGYGNDGYSEFDVLPREEIEKIIDGLNSYDIYKTAHEAYHHQMASGWATIDLQTGELKGETQYSNTFNHPWDDVQIYLFGIPQNAEPFNENDLLDEDEQKEFKELNEDECIDLDDFMREKGIDVDERYENCYEYFSLEYEYFSLELEVNSDDENIQGQLDNFYNKEYANNR